MTESATQIAEVRLKSPILQSALESRGKTWAVLARDGLHILEITEHASGTPRLQKRKTFKHDDKQAWSKMALLPDGQMLVRVSAASSFPFAPSKVEAVELDQGHVLGSFAFASGVACLDLQITADGEHAVLLDTAGRITLWRLADYKVFLFFQKDIYQTFKWKKMIDESGGFVAVD